MLLSPGPRMEVNPFVDGWCGASRHIIFVMVGYFWYNGQTGNHCHCCGCLEASFCHCCYHPCCCSCHASGDVSHYIVSTLPEVGRALRGEGHSCNCHSFHPHHHCRCHSKCCHCHRALTSTTSPPLDVGRALCCEDHNLHCCNHLLLLLEWLSAWTDVSSLGVEVDTCEEILRFMACLAFKCLTAKVST